MSKANVTIQYRTQAVNDLKIFYREAGEPEAHTILLLHGFPTSSHMFRDLIPFLAHDYHVIAPDLPGFGSRTRRPHRVFPTPLIVWQT